MTKSWTDERLDRIDQRFDRVDADLRALRLEMRDRFAGVEGRIDALGRTLLQLGGIAIAALLGLIATQL